MATFDPKHTKGPSALNNVKYRFMALTRELYRAGTHGALRLDAVTDETLTNKADVPLHPTSAGISITDHAIRGARAYTVSGFLGNPLEQDHFHPTFEKPSDQQRVVFYPPEATALAAAEREDAFSEALEGFLGVPVDIFSPRFGKLQRFALVSYNDQRDGTTRVRIDLSFQELRVASVSEIAVPKIERAKAQAKPDEVGPCVLTDEQVEVDETLYFGDRTILESAYDYQDAKKQEDLPALPTISQALGFDAPADRGFSSF